MATSDDTLERLERQLGWLLVTGVTASAVCLMAGLVLLFASEGGWADHLLTAGLLILMATPMLRVVVSIVEYVRIREWFFVLTTVVVLAELGIGVLYALHR
jgi:uncharacterized membrane protein